MNFPGALSFSISECRIMISRVQINILHLRLMQKERLSDRNSFTNENKCQNHKCFQKLMTKIVYLVDGGWRDL